MFGDVVMTNHLLDSCIPGTAQLEAHKKVYFDSRSLHAQSCDSRQEKLIRIYLLIVIDLDST